MIRRTTILGATLLALILAAAPAAATIPVIDFASLTQLIQQMLSWQQQLEGMRQQLAQMHDTYASMTGRRGMEAVLQIPPQARNYLPGDWVALMDVVTGASASYRDLAGVARAQLAANAILRPEDLARLPDDLRSLLSADRRAVAGSQALTRAAYGRSSDRFAALQTLIDRIGAAPDAKAIAELQGRIAAEQAMIANEGLKLVALAQLAEADGASRSLARQEQALANHGSFALRFAPTPPAP